MEAALTRKEGVEAAHEMIERFGLDASSQIEQRIRELDELGEADAARFWRDVLAIVKVILHTSNSRSIN